jgi:hypothetical protein
LGQCRSASAGWFPAEIDLTSRASSPRSMLVRVATDIMEIDLMRLRAADLGTCQV